MKTSNCCGAANVSNGDTDFAEFGICPECRENCQFEDDEEDPEEDDASLDIDPDIELRSDNWGSPGSQEYNLKLKNQTR